MSRKVSTLNDESSDQSEPRPFRRDCSYQIGAVQVNSKLDPYVPKFQHGTMRVWRGDKLIDELKCQNIRDLFRLNPIGMKAKKSYAIYEESPQGDVNYFGRDTVLPPKEKRPRATIRRSGLGDDIVPQTNIYGGAPTENPRSGRMNAMEVMHNQIEAERREKGELITIANEALQQNREMMSQLQGLTERYGNITKELFDVGQQLARSQAAHEMDQRLIGIKEEAVKLAKKELEQQRPDGLSGVLEHPLVQALAPHIGEVIVMVAKKFMGPEPAAATPYYGAAAADPASSGSIPSGAPPSVAPPAASSATIRPQRYSGPAPSPSGPPSGGIPVSGYPAGGHPSVSGGYPSGVPVSNGVQMEEV